MDDAAICALPIKSLAADNCALFLWTTWFMLLRTLEVIRSWGFEYRTMAFIWVKQNRNGKGLFTGMGGWTRSNTEPCLLATQGHPTRLAMDIHEVVMAPVGEHSRKPDEVHSRIERLFPEPRLELFAQRPVEGWTTWGNEIKREVFREAAE
jgi:N6-adenosine-specific RNA methylase IME4